MGKNEVATNNGSKISFKGADALRNEITQGMKLVTKGYIAIMPQLAKLYDTKGFKALGYKNFDDMCKTEWNMSHGTTVGIRKVWDLIGIVTVNNEYKVPDKFADWGYTALLTIATDKAKFEEAGIKPFKTFTPDMTIKEMKEALKLALDAKLEAEEDNAIDSTFEEVDGGEPNGEVPNGEVPNGEELKKDIFESALNDTSTIRKVFKSNEKAMKDAKVIAYLDSLEVTIKELKALYKKFNE